MKTYWIWKSPRGGFCGEPKKHQIELACPLLIDEPWFISEKNLKRLAIDLGYKIVKVKLVEVKR